MRGTRGDAEVRDDEDPVRSQRRGHGPRDALAGRDRRTCSNATTCAWWPRGPRSGTCAERCPPSTRSSARASRCRTARSTAGRPCARTSATPATSCPDTVRDWMPAVHEWRPDVVITDFEPLAGIYARDQPDAADRGRQHQHARPLPPRRRDHRRRARGLHARQGGDPLDGARRGRVPRHDLLRAAARARRHDSGAADRPPGDRGRGRASAASTWSSTRAASRR